MALLKVISGSRDYSMLYWGRIGCGTRSRPTVIAIDRSKCCSLVIGSVADSVDSADTNCATDY